ncbi:MAG: helix-turn-helix domain-containing protein, partial [candidate division WOR-3 bacterium]
KLNITQQEIAGYLGSTRIPINRVINMLKKLGVIKKIIKGKIIIDPYKLKDILKRKITQGLKFPRRFLMRCPSCKLHI